MSHRNRIKELVSNSIEAKQQLMNDDMLLQQIEYAVESIINCFQNNGRLWLCGNGGSAADAQHIAAEFSGRFYKDRPALPAEALHVNSSYITSVGNDYSFEDIYSRMIAGIANKGDVLIAISTSGNSKNIINAAKKAMDKNITCIALTGSNGGELKNHCDILLNVPSQTTPRVQEVHGLVGHIICELVEAQLFNA